MNRFLPIVLAAGILLPCAAHALPDVTKPGPFTVGVTNLTFTKTSETTGAPRPLDTVIWYPAVPDTGTDSVLGRRDAEVVRRRFPLVLFSHGLCGIPEQSIFLTQALASWGFIVAAPPHPGNRFTDGFPACFTTINDSFANRVADIRFTIDSVLAESKRRDLHFTPSRFAHRVNPHRIGMSGHSFGGQTTLRVALAEPRVIAALALAPALFAALDPGQIKTPTMIQGAELDSLAPYQTDAVGAFGRLVGPRFLLDILNAGHYAFSDLCAAVLFGGRGHDCDPGTLSQADAHADVLRFGVPFLLRYVGGQRRFARLLTPASAPAGVVWQATAR